MSSWELVSETFSGEEIGGMMYEMLFEIAPNLRTLFSKPKQVMAMKLVDMLTMIVNMIDTADEKTEVMTNLGLRHVLYGVERTHVPVMAHVLISTLKQAVGTEWTDDLVRMTCTCNMSCMHFCGCADMPLIFFVILELNSTPLCFI